MKAKKDSGEQAVREAEQRGEPLEDITPRFKDFQEELTEERLRRNSETRHLLSRTRPQSIHRKRAKK